MPHGPLTKECDHSYLSQGTYQTSKHNYFKAISDWVAEIIIALESVYQKYLFCHKEDILTPYEPPPCCVLEQDTLLPESTG